MWVPYLVNRIKHSEFFGLVKQHPTFKCLANNNHPDSWAQDTASTPVMHHEKAIRDQCSVTCSFCFSILKWFICPFSSSTQSTWGLRDCATVISEWRDTLNFLSLPVSKSRAVYFELYISECQFDFQYIRNIYYLSNLNGSIIL